MSTAGWPLSFGKQRAGSTKRAGARHLCSEARWCAGLDRITQKGRMPSTVSEHASFISFVASRWPQAAQTSVAVVLLLVGCATPLAPSEPSSYASETQRAQIGRIAVVATQDAPSIAVEPTVSGKGGGAAKSAGTAAEVGLRGCILTGPFLPICLVTLMPVTVLGGAVYGAATSPSKGEVTVAKHSIESVLGELDGGKRLRDQTLRMAQKSWPHIVTGAPTREAAEETDPAIGEVDTVLEVGVTRLEAVKAQPDKKDAPLVIVMEARARLVSASDGREIYRGTHVFLSGPRRFLQWGENDAEPLRRALDVGFDGLATDIVERALFLYPLPKVEPFGLRPLYPEKPGSLSFSKIATVDSLRPTLRWEAFPRTADLESSGNHLARARNIRYELRIARTADEVAGIAAFNTVYEKNNLPEPQHTLEQPLEPGREYFWSVRARFELDESTRLTPWSTRYSDSESNVLVPSRSSHVFRTPAVH